MGADRRSGVQELAAPYDTRIYQEGAFIWHRCKCCIRICTVQNVLHLSP